MKLIILTLLIAAVSARSIEHFSSFEEALEHEKAKYDFDANHDLDLHHFNNFKSQHGKQYESKEEEHRRFQVFRVNLLKIKLLNAFDSGSATYAVNNFADLEEKEFLATYTGATLDRNQVESEVNFAEAEFNRDADLPKEADWREKGAVTDVKNQGQCGSCWAFAAVGSVESQNQIVNGELVRLSEQQLVDCDTTSHGCSGGFMSWAYESIMKLGGIVLEKDYPYTAKDGECTFDKNLAKVQVQNYVNLTKNEDEIAQYVAQKGPVAIGINASLMQFYNGGIAHPNFITKWMCSPKGLNHGVFIVGFGEAKKRGKPEPFWIIKNSWGPKWGRQGYYYIHRGSNACGVAEFATGPVVAKNK